MVLTVDTLADGRVATWQLTADGTARTVHAYQPTLFVGDAVADLYGGSGGPSPSPPARDGLSAALRDLRTFLAGQQVVADLSVERHRQTFRTDPRPLLRIDATDCDAVRTIAKRVRQFGDPDAYTCYNVDLTPQFRYCLETETPAIPDQTTRDLRTLRLSVPRHETGTDALAALTVDGDRVGTTPQAVVEELDRLVDARGPDVLVCSTAEIVPQVFETAATHDLSVTLGREPGYTKLAGASTYESYGQVGHSPARYTVPGRVILDESNSFFYHEAGLAGCLDLVARAGLPLEELGWASIGRVLTALQIREAQSRDVLVPWRAWRPELFKTASTLDAADRGGTTLSPAVGVHEDVHELDFASLYPNIIRTRNISPETVRCGCCTNEAVPGLGYSICEEPGYLPAVLGPLIDARSELKAARAAADEPAEQDRLSAAISAIKWILVSCFGYQGFSNAKFGRIACHEAINAYAREILLDAKATFEEAGWRVLHGIVDSIWVTPAPDRSQRPLETVAREISAAADIELEYECAFDWVAFCPRRDGDAGALTRYFGKRRDTPLPAAEATLGDAIKTRGIEGRQHSTAPWVETVQAAALRTFDATRSPEAVCDVLRDRLATLREGNVDASELVIEQRVTKDVDAYTQETLTVAALKRARDHDVGFAPGQRVRYVVVAADSRGAARVRLPFEEIDRYDTAWYADAAVRAVESILSPVGWREPQIRAQLADQVDTTLAVYQD